MDGRSSMQRGGTASLLALALLTGCDSVIGRKAARPSAVAVAGPLRVSAANPRYFADTTGRIVYLTGSHTWENLQDSGPKEPLPPFDYTRFLDDIVARGHNFFRLWTWEQVSGSADTRRPWWFSPSQYQRTGPGNALDGKPRFDLTKFDEEYFRRLRARVEQARTKGVYVSVMLFNGWSLDDKGHGRANPWLGHPYNAFNNINGVDGDADRDGKGTESHSMRNAAVTRAQEAYVRKVIDTINDLDNVLYEVSNESASSSSDWQYHIIRFVRSYESGKPRQHPIGMTAEYPGGSNQVLFDSPADWISPNGVEGGLDDPPAADGRKVIIDDTDHLCGICGHEEWAWKSFLRGRNPIYMDVYDGHFELPQPVDPRDKGIERLRNALGFIRAYAQRANLARMTPHGELASTGFCLAFPDHVNGEYFAYVVPSQRTVTIDLSATPRNLMVEWVSPRLERVIVKGSIEGGAKRTLRSPFPFGAAIVYLHP